jgi:hypothetical protein
MQKSNVTKKKQQMITNSTKKSSFNKDLCFALLLANIPLNELSNPSFKNVLETYTEKKILTETTLRLRTSMKLLTKQ